MPPPGLLAGAPLPLTPELLELPGLEPKGEVGRCGLEVGDPPDESDDEPPPNGFAGRGALAPELDDAPDDEPPPNGFGRGAFDPEAGGGLLAGRANGLLDAGFDSIGSPLSSRSSYS